MLFIPIESTSEVRGAVRATSGNLYLLNSRRDEQSTARNFTQLQAGDQEAEDDSDTPDLVPDDTY